MPHVGTMRHSLAATIFVVGSISIAITLSSCSDESTDPKHPGGKSFLQLFANETPGVSLLGLDTSQIDGLAFTELYFETDNRFGNDVITTHWAGFSDSSGAVTLTSASAGGTSLTGDTSSPIMETRVNSQAVTPGMPVVWDVHYPAGLAFHDSIELPQRFNITTIVPYSDYSAAAGITIGTGTSVSGGDVMITLEYDHARTLLAGEDTSEVTNGIDTSFSTMLSASDNGSLVIPAGQLSDLPKNRVYMLIVHRFRYETRPLTNGTRAGLLAMITEMIPIILRA